MTREDLLSLKAGEVVKFTRIDKSVNLYSEYKVGDELVFYRFNDDISSVDFVRTSGEYAAVTHFSYEFCHYIERKVVLERHNKLKELGI